MEVCYYCGEPKESVEHVPPKSFFPTDCRNELITVPSCHKHNSDKSDIDEYVRTLFIGTTSLDNEKITPVVEKSIRSLIRHNGAKYLEMFKKPLEVNHSNGDKSISVEVNREYLESFIISVLKGIFFYENQFVWKDIIDTRYYFSDENLTADEKIKRCHLSSKFVKETAKGKNKEIFFYNIYKNNDSYSIYLCFFNDVKVIGYLYKIKNTS